MGTQNDGIIVVTRIGVDDEVGSKMLERVRWLPDKGSKYMAYTYDVLFSNVVSTVKLTITLKSLKRARPSVREIIAPGT